MMILRCIISLLFVLSGCISLPQNEQTENLIVPPSVQTSVDKGLESGYFSTGNWPEKKWWEVFGSHELNTLITQALKQNPSIQGIQRRVQEAKEVAKVVRSQLFPLLFFDADESWEYLSKHGLYRALNPKIPINANLVDLTLSAQYEFDFWGKNRNLFHAALGKAKALEAENAAVDLLTTTTVAQAYFALKTNLVRKKLYDELWEVRKAILDLQNHLQENALLSLLLPLRSEETVLESEQWVIGIEEEIETDKHLLNILLGRGPDEKLFISDQLPPFIETIPLPNQLSLDLLSRRPDLMAQIWRVEALAHEVGAAKADFFPNINLKAFIGLESVLYRLLFNSQSKTAGLQPAIHLPIFTAGAIRANVRAKKAAFDEAVFDYNNLLLKSTQEVADLLVLIQSVFSQKEEQEGVVASAAYRFDLTMLRFESGLDNLLASYFAKEEWINKELHNVTLLYNQYLACIKLIRALGGGYESEYAVPLKSQGAGE